MANPELPVGIYSLNLGILVCQCNYISSTIDELRFIQGFEPEDAEAFRLQFYAALKRLPVAWLFSSEPTPPYAALADALEAMVLGLGARATIVQISPRRDARACTHRR